ncbi:MAG: DNA polymerase III subunit delta' [Candidatus Aminicenantes bacterium]|nr:MAG: DNA polymerase III subunit delta' [Candidatus Aminicenantes bacterium]
MGFKDVIGNNGVKKILHRALKQKKLPNSLLFAGPEGIGKKQTALIVAKALNCLKKTSDACEECTHCKAINNRNFPDVMVISPAKDVLKIDQMRLLKDTAYMKPMAGRKRVFIVCEAEKMNDEASNSLLKILEEPPPFSHITLVTPNPYRIIPTLKSRCQIFLFSPIPKEEIQKALVARGFQPEKAKILSLLVDGNLKEALSLDWEEVRSQRNQAWDLFLALHRREKAAPLLKQYSVSRGVIKEDLEKTLEILALFCRDVILIKEQAEPEFLLNPDFEQDLRGLARSVPLSQAMDFLSEMDFAIAALRRNLNVNVLVSSIFSNFLERSHV